MTMQPLTKVKAYIPDDDFVWLAVEILSEEPKETYHVEITDKLYIRRDKKRTIHLKRFPYLNALPLQDEEIVVTGVDDLTSLNYLHEASILENLEKRFNSKQPYTYTGNLCIAINPYKWLPIYSVELRQQYCERLRHELKPHVYAISAASIRGLSNYDRNQSIIVSGESGAGKTETVKILMNHVAHVTGRNKMVIIERVLQANPLMESFGNAKTARNDNSSRFGKFTQLQFDSTTDLTGSRCVTYLLEKSRLIHQNNDERNYHIFYQLLSAPESLKTLVALGGKQCCDFQFTNAGDTTTREIEGVSDAERFDQTRKVLELLGISNDHSDSLWRVLSAVLHLGQIVYEGDVDQAHVVQCQLENVSIFCQLIGISSEAFCEKTTSRKIAVNGLETTVNLSCDQAFDCRDALAKDIYERLFQWLVMMINISTEAVLNPISAKQDRFISLLDIFGFECFIQNHFEQLCINFANEKLQQRFTRDVFQAVQEEYQEEGLDWESIGYKDNADILELLEGKMGVVPLLNEECLLPNGGDINFLAKLTGQWKSHPNFINQSPSNREEFAVLHFAGSVSYSVIGFVEKNRDTLAGDVATMMSDSALPWLRDCYQRPVNNIPSYTAPITPQRHHRPATASPLQRLPSSTSSRKGFMNADTVITKFKSQLEALLHDISGTNVQYVRCIKPNAFKSSRDFNRPMVVSQLRSAGMIEAIRISRAAYPYRVTHTEFVSRFGHLRPRLSRRLRELQENAMEQCRLILSDIWPNQHYLGKIKGRSEACLSSTAYELGRSRVYFSNGVLESLENIRGNMVFECVAIIQKFARGRIVRKRFIIIMNKLLSLQRRLRTFIQRCNYLKLLKKLLVLQSLWRRKLAQKIARKLRFDKLAATIVRRRVASYIIRKRFLKKLAVHRETMEKLRKYDVLKSELEKERRARVAAEELNWVNSTAHEAKYAVGQRETVDGYRRVIVNAAESDKVMPTENPRAFKLLEDEKNEFRSKIEKEYESKNELLTAEMMSLVEEMEERHKMETEKLSAELRKRESSFKNLEQKLACLEAASRQVGQNPLSSRENELRSQLLTVTAQLTMANKKKEESEKLLLVSLNKMTEDHNRLHDERIQLLRGLHAAQEETDRLASELRTCHMVQLQLVDDHKETIANMESRFSETIASLQQELSAATQNSVSKDKATIASLKQQYKQLQDKFETLSRENAIDAKSEIAVKDRRQSDLLSELIELRAKNQILQRQISAEKLKGGVSEPVTEINKLIREKEHHAAEKKVLLDLLSAQCDEVDIAEKAQYEADRLRKQALQHGDDYFKCSIEFLENSNVDKAILQELTSIYQRTAMNVKRWNQQSDEEINSKTHNRGRQSSGISVSKSRRSATPTRQIRSRSHSRGHSRSKSPAYSSHKARVRDLSRFRGKQKPPEAAEDATSMLSSPGGDMLVSFPSNNMQFASPFSLPDEKIDTDSESRKRICSPPFKSASVLTLSAPSDAIGPAESVLSASTLTPTRSNGGRATPSSPVSSLSNTRKSNIPLFSSKGNSPLQHSLQYQPPRRQAGMPSPNSNSPLLNPSRPIPHQYSPAVNSPSAHPGASSGNQSNVAAIGSAGAISKGWSFF